MFDGDTGAGGETTASAATETQTTTTDDIDGIDGLGDKGKEAIRKERVAAKAATDALKETQKKLADLERDKADRETAEAKAKEAEAAKKGEFEELATKREQERDAAKADATRLTAENDQFRAAMATGVAAGWKDLPEEVRKVGEKQHPEDDVLGRWSFLHDPDTKALVAKLTDKSETKRGNGRDPRPTGAGGLPTATQLADEMRRARGYPARSGD